MAMVDHGGAFASHTYFDRGLQMPAVKLLPGEYHVADSDIAEVTVLGSCVAACIRDRRRGIGGMNHFMLPDSGKEGISGSGASSRYGVFAMEILINELIKMGAGRAMLEAKVFGGANVMDSLASSNVGQQNADFVLDFLATEGIPVVARDLVDIHPRKVCFCPASGRALVRKLPVTRDETIFERERDYGRRINRPSSGDIEIFGKPVSGGGDIELFG